MTNTRIDYCQALLFAALLCHFPVSLAEQPIEPVSGACYGHLAELVRSSNFPFKYVPKEKANLLTDNDTGDSIMAQLFFDTNGTGTIGWVQYDVTQRQLFNVSGDVDEPEELTFDASFATEYEACIGR
jgi:hypothetical protein